MYNKTPKRYSQRMGRKMWRERRKSKLITVTRVK
jgi:hypothetical protein